MVDMLDVARCYTSKASNAASRNLDFKLDFMAFANIKSQKVCAYSGLPFSEDNPLTIERINNDLGYVDGNVIPVCLAWNRCRADFTSETIHKGIAKLLKSLNEAESILAGLIKAKDKVEIAGEKRAEQIREIKTNAFGVKPYIAAKSQQWWDNHENTRHRQQKNADKYVELIDNLYVVATKKGRPALSKGQRKNERIYNEKLANLNKCVQSTEAQLSKFYANRPMIGAKVEVEAQDLLLKQDQTHFKMVTIKTEIETQMERVDSIRKRFDILNLLVPVLEHFENLSDREKSLIAEGLPLSTSTYKLLRHKAGKALLVKGE